MIGFGATALLLTKANQQHLNTPLSSTVWFNTIQIADAITVEFK
jgi:hypothetical protein